MTLAVDANVLIYAAHADSPFHQRARDAVRRVFEDDEITYIFWPTVMAFLRVTTQPGLLTRPLAHDAALAAIQTLMALPNVRTGSENSDFWRSYTSVTDGVSVRGKLVPDAHIVALMHLYGVYTILTHDRDFRKFDGIRVIDPFV